MDFIGAKDVNRHGSFICIDDTPIGPAWPAVHSRVHKSTDFSVLGSGWNFFVHDSVQY